MIVKIFNFKKGEQGLKVQKLCKQGRGQKVQKQMREWKQVGDRAKGLLYLEQNSKVFAIPILTAI